MRLANSQVANDTDQTAFDTFVQPESVDLSGNAPEQPCSSFTLESILQGQYSSILDDIQKSESCSAAKDVPHQIKKRDVKRHEKALKS